jgi:DNA-binding NarL/FixJ family response regulator
MGLNCRANKMEDDASLFAAMRAGARGYVLKGAHHQELLQTIRTVATGQVLFGAGIASRIMHFFYQLESSPVGALPETLSPELTPREIEILSLIAKGMNNQYIAQQLVISDKTVRNHITNIFSKLQVADRAQVIIKARGGGVGELKFTLPYYLQPDPLLNP